ncbi:universal stress protein [Paractinoplanes atraurantiacus]|uniref:Nucleotide-binding universal stress protein, UspA family n=1 Tax=Paractinoplanes atraurantiacus TaxID=1036182 RepID=A0A285JGA2_9ACTN|nr:universal stress protein [Actinoplanes atraurantiacus]SNY59308.1 Nucleotide-binding universal stress protein, UspA family [Actinoplanes atraurantiacus]
MTSRHLIVVGVDGSEGGRRALEWAVQEAEERGSTVRAVTAWSWDGLEFGPVTATNPEEAKQRATRLLAKEIEALPPEHVPVDAEVIEGAPAEVLGDRSRSADLLVLGSHGHSGMRHTVLGSVSEKSIRKAACPVVVIPVPAQAAVPSTSPGPR